MPPGHRSSKKKKDLTWIGLNKFEFQIITNHNQYNHVKLTTECFLPVDHTVIILPGENSPMKKFSQALFLLWLPPRPVTLANYRSYHCVWERAAWLDTGAAKNTACQLNYRQKMNQCTANEQANCKKCLHKYQQAWTRWQVPNSQTAQ